MSWLVDTNVISELSRKAPNPKVAEWLLERQDDLFISVLCIGELEKGLAMLAEATRRVRLERWVRNDVLAWFGDRVLPVDARVAVRWGRLLGEAGEPLPAVDSLIAATAMTHRLTVATRDVEGFSRTGVSLVNPWE
jgi:toxin FitB